MKSLNDYILEMKGDDIDEQWINDKKPVITKDGRQVIIKKIDYSEVPNIIIGMVSWKQKLLDYKWDLDTGECTEAKDTMGNPKKPDDSDKLIKNA